jgi:hypothetical protein
VNTLVSLARGQVEGALVGVRAKAGIRGNRGSNLGCRCVPCGLRQIPGRRLGHGPLGRALLSSACAFHRQSLHDRRSWSIGRTYSLGSSGPAKRLLKHPAGLRSNSSMRHRLILPDTSARRPTNEFRRLHQHVIAFSGSPSGHFDSPISVLECLVCHFESLVFRPDREDQRPARSYLIVTHGPARSRVYPRLFNSLSSPGAGWNGRTS